MEEELKRLLKGWQEGSLSQREATDLLQKSKDPQLQTDLESWLQQQYNNTDQLSYFSTDQKKAIYHNAVHGGSALPSDIRNARTTLMQIPQAGLRKRPSRDSRRKRRILRAVASFCVIGFCFFLFFKLNHPPAQVVADKQTAAGDIAAPLAATPTISWGQENSPVTIDHAIKEQAARVRKTKDGRLVFQAAGTAAQPSTVAVPRGSRPVHIQLPDGSQVWLNTGSSLKFPGAFEAGKRTVFLTGEAYFEVVHHKDQVFEVQQGSNTVSVLGTHFNINAYADNPKTKVTLLEGLVQINHNDYLHPSEQAVLNEGNIQIRKDIDLQQVMAWKNNQFYFDGTSAEQILKELSRWYNIDIVYKGQVPQGHYSGIISKDNSLAQVLAILEAGGMKFKLNQQSLWIY